MNHNNIKNETELKLIAKTYIENGQLVPDEYTNNMLRHELKIHKCYSGFIFDGYPRTIAQAEALDEMLKEDLNQEVAITLSLKVDDEILVERLLNRGKLSGRTDDANEGIIRERIAEYYDKTDVVAEYYKAQGKYIEINGVGEVTEDSEKLYNEIA